MGPIRLQNSLLILTAAIIAAGWVCIALIGLPSRPDILGIVFVLGTLFGQATLAGAWCALGPFALIRRLPLSFAWVAIVVISFGVNVARSEPDGLMVLLVYAGAVTGQWLLVQGPLWIVAAAYGLHICSANGTSVGSGSRSKQFGIREVMILTFLVALVLGTARFLLGSTRFGGGSTVSLAELALFGFFVVANTVIALPLIASALVSRRPAAAIAIAFSRSQSSRVLNSRCSAPSGRLGSRDQMTT